jgi:hypothetical protein
MIPDAGTVTTGTEIVRTHARFHSPIAMPLPSALATQHDEWIPFAKRRWHAGPDTTDSHAP